MTLTELTAYIHTHIPLTFHIGAVVDFYDGKKMVVSAPLDPNLNHRNTAFGGSISTLGILSGWALLFLQLKESGLKTRLVIQKSTSDFIEPIEQDFTATCFSPPEEDWEKFMKTLKKHGKARVRLDSQILCGSRNCGNHEGTYVAILLN